jgi:hypothetical protein
MGWVWHTPIGRMREIKNVCQVLLEQLEREVSLRRVYVRVEEGNTHIKMGTN